MYRGLEKDSFIALLQRNDATEIMGFIKANGKRKKVNPITYIEEIPPDNKSREISIDKNKIITVKADDIKEITNTPIETDSKRRKSNNGKK